MRRSIIRRVRIGAETVFQIACQARFHVMKATTIATEPTFKTDPRSGAVKWTLATWQRAYDAGLFPLWAEYELMDGELYLVPPSSPEHDGLVEKLVGYLRSLLAAAPVVVREEKPLYISEDSAPKCDLVIAQPHDYTEHKMSPADVLVVGEVCRSNRRSDFGLKPGVYARARIPQYWVFDVSNQTFHVYTLDNDSYVETTPTEGTIEIAGVDIAIPALITFAFGPKA